MARKKKLEQPEEEKFSFEEGTEQLIENLRESVEPQLKQKGVVRLITKNRIIIVYGDELGASIDYDPKIHFDLKVGDEIEF